VDPTARSFVLDLLSTLRRGTMPVGALVAAGALFDLSENNVRVALARLRAAGRVERDERGRYRLGSGAAPVAERVRSWRSPASATRRWGGSWIGVQATAGPRRGRARRERERALRLLGFEALAPGLHVRPDNLRTSLSELRDQLSALGLEPGALVFALRDLDAASDARARTLWDVAALRAGYRRSLAEIAASEARLPALSEGESMAESFRVGGSALRQLVLDPLLPEEILPGGEREALVEAMRRYDRAGRACWAAFLGRFDVIHRYAPADTRFEPGLETGLESGEAASA
jgi:phenylacetic acid degradation operon negative regulatory protein